MSKKKEKIDFDSIKFSTLNGFELDRFNTFSKFAIFLIFFLLFIFLSLFVEFYSFSILVILFLFIVIVILFMTSHERYKKYSDFILSPNTIKVTLKVLDVYSSTKKMKSINFNLFTLSSGRYYYLICELKNLPEPYQDRLIKSDGISFNLESFKDKQVTVYYNKRNPNEYCFDFWDIRSRLNLKTNNIFLYIILGFAIFWTLKIFVFH